MAQAADSSPEHTNYDSPWKEIIERYFPQFMAFFFPTAHSEIDWLPGYTFLDKELQQVVREAEIGPRRVDKLVEVASQGGSQVWVLIHIEVQGQPETDFAERMYVYNYRLFDRYHKEIASMAVLTDENPRWRPTQFTYKRFGCQVLLDFPMAKLLDYKQQGAQLEASNNPFAVVVLAHLETQATRHKPQERYAAKLRLAKMLYQRGYGRQEILDLFRFIDWLMTLPPELDRQFETALEQFETEVKMQYISGIERRALKRGREEGLEEGREQGREQGLRESILTYLSIRFGEVPEQVASGLQAIESVEQLRGLLHLTATASSLSDFQRQLENM